MPLLNSDIVAYQSANTPEDDVATVGGGINTLGLVVFSPLAANDSLGVVSDNAADNQQVTITGRVASGAIESEAIVLNGTTRVAGTKVFERVLKIVLSAAAAGVVQVDRNTSAPNGDVIIDIPAAITSVRRLFYDAVSQVGAKTIYDKIHIKNNNGTFSLTNAVASLSADPIGKFEMGLAATKGDTVTATNRITAPAGITFVNEPTTQNVPGGTLGPSESIGLWLKLSLLDLDAAFKTTVTARITGAST